MFQKDEVVWAKIRGFPWWPGIIVKIGNQQNNEKDLDQIEQQQQQIQQLQQQQQQQQQQQLIINFIGENSHAMLPQDKVLKFKENYDEMQKQKKNKKLSDSIAIALKILLGESSYEDEKNKLEVIERKKKLRLNRDLDPDQVQSQLTSIDKNNSVSRQFKNNKNINLIKNILNINNYKNNLEQQNNNINVKSKNNFCNISEQDKPQKKIKIQNNKSNNFLIKENTYSKSLEKNMHLQENKYNIIDKNERKKIVEYKSEESENIVDEIIDKNQEGVKTRRQIQQNVKKDLKKEQIIENKDKNINKNNNNNNNLNSDCDSQQIKDQFDKNVQDKKQNSSNNKNNKIQDEISKDYERIKKTVENFEDQIENLHKHPHNESAIKISIQNLLKVSEQIEEIGDQTVIDEILKKELLRSLVSAKHKIEKETTKCNIEILMNIIKMFKKKLWQFYYHNGDDNNKLNVKKINENIDEDCSSLPSRKQGSQSQNSNQIQNPPLRKKVCQKLAKILKQNLKFEIDKAQQLAIDIENIIRKRHPDMKQDYKNMIYKIFKKIKSQFNLENTNINQAQQLLDYYSCQ